MNFFDHKDLGNHLLQLFPKVVKHPVYVCIARNFLVINVCNQGKTLCSPCISLHTPAPRRQTLPGNINPIVGNRDEMSQAIIISLKA